MNTKEIAEWLREDAENLRVIAECIPHNAPMRAIVEKYMETASGRAAQVEAMGWQPIETAPKDGTSVLLWPCFSNRVVYAGKYIDGKRVKRWVTQWADMPIPGEITQWMPLPEPPTNNER